MQASAGQRERLAMSVERLNESSERITESRRTIMETEELGISILQDLHQQRETLLHSHKKVCFYWILSLGYDSFSLGILSLGFTCLE